MKCKSIFAALAIFLGMGFVCAQEEPDSALQREFVIIASEHPYDLNPYTANYSAEAQILSGLFEGLYSYDPKTLDPVPALASEFKLSRDKKRWTFTIREGAKFSNGDPITAYSVRDSWLTLLATDGAPYASLLDPISGVEAFRMGRVKSDSVGIIARDERTLVVRLDSPTAHLQRILCHHAFGIVNGKKNVYSGAFVLKSHTNGEIRLEKNENYWDAAHVYLPAITIKGSNDAKENSWKFNTGNADWVSGMVDTAAILNKNAIRIAAEYGTEYLFFSCKNEPWDKADFRNALVAAVPWAALRKNSLVPAKTFVYPLTGNRDVEGLEETAPEEALDLIALAREKAGMSKSKKLTLTFGITNSERMKKQVEILKVAWEPLGVELKVQTTPEDRYLLSIPSWNADLFTYSWIGDFADPLAFLELFREGSTLNQSKWHNREYNRLLQASSETTDTIERNKLLSAAEQVLLDDGVILPISHSVCLHAINPETVGGWYTNTLDIHPFKYMYIKEEIITDKPSIFEPCNFKFKEETAAVPGIVLR